MSKPDPMRTEALGRHWTRQLGHILENTAPPGRSDTVQAIICAAASLFDELHPGKAATYLRIVADELDVETKPPRQLDQERPDDPSDPQVRLLVLAEENADLARQVNAAKRETRKKTAELGAALELYETMKAEKEAAERRGQ